MTTMHGTHANCILTVLSTEIPGFYPIPPSLSLETGRAWNAPCFI